MKSFLNFLFLDLIIICSAISVSLDLSHTNNRIELSPIKHSGEYVSYELKIMHLHNITDENSLYVVVEDEIFCSSFKLEISITNPIYNLQCFHNSYCVMDLKD